MKPLNVTQLELPYHRDAAELAARFADLPGFVFLDSRKRRAEVGQYDIVTALPDHLYSVPDNQPAALMDWMQTLETSLVEGGRDSRTRIAVGFIDYEAAAASAGVGNRKLRGATAGIYSWHILQDHLQGKCWLIEDPDLDPAVSERIRERLEQPAEIANTPFSLQQPFRAETPKEKYLESIHRIKHYIAAGDCYQVNYAQRFSAPYEGDSFAAYCQLRDVAPGDFSAFLRLSSDHAILSLSPERFLSVEGRRIKTQPIKGTRSRSPDPLKDLEIAQELRRSAKDRAENVMITDLLRNDLGRFCEPGSVKTPELCALHSFDNVHHLVSLVEGKLRPEVSPGQVLAGCSPGGSITGAPKRRAMEIIDQLERSPRGVYCGSVFALGADGWMQSSIAIRTFEAVDNQLYCWGGGGIVHDSDPESEYQETLDKVGGFMRALEAGLINR